MGKMSAMLLVTSLILFFHLAGGVQKEADPSIQLPTPPFPETTFFEDLKEIIENWSLSQRVPPDFFCNSCRQVSRKVETFLNEAILNKEIETISGGLCHIVPSDLQVKCSKLLELYLREGILFFQLVFLEKNLCNYTGFCPPNNNNASSFSMQSLRLPLLHEMRGNAICDACHAAAEELRKGLVDHNQQMNILKALFEACEKLQTHADQCKRSVFQYGPLVIGNLHKFLAGNDLCVFLRMCEGPAPPPEVNFTPLLHRLLAAVKR